LGGLLPFLWQSSSVRNPPKGKVMALTTTSRSRPFAALKVGLGNYREAANGGHSQTASSVPAHPSGIGRRAVVAWLATLGVFNTSQISGAPADTPR
jgi:hypothetical protein